MSDLKVIRLQRRSIIIGGLGKYIYEKGIPLALVLNKVNKDNLYETSLYHLCDELLREKWNPKRVISYLKEEMKFIVHTSKLESQDIVEYCTTNLQGYKYDIDKQSELKFRYLWNTSSENVINDKTLRNNICKNLEFNVAL